MTYNKVKYTKEEFDKLKAEALLRGIVTTKEFNEFLKEK